MRYLNSNFIVLAVGTTIIATFSMLFYFDVNRRIDVGDAQVIGTITFKKHVAQRKYSRQVVWEDLDQTEPIYNNDTIRTGDKSEAVVKIKDGSEFTLNENSMVLVSMGSDRLDIEFNQGSITANRDNVAGDDIKKLTIRTAGTTVSIDKSNVNISTDKGDSLNLVVNKGDAVVNTGGTEKTVTVDQKAMVLLKSAKVDVVKQQIVLLAPAHDHFFVTGEPRQPVNFSWKPVEGRGDLYLEIIPGDTSAGKAFKKKIDGTSHVLDLPKGSYSWRVSLRDRATGKEETSDSRRFTVLRQEAINLVSPPDNAAYSYRTKPQMIHFKWTESGIATGYSLIIARDGEMKQVYKSFTSPGTSVSTDTLEKGTYFWKVASVSGISTDASGGESPVRKFVVSQRETVGAPEQVFPTDGRKFSRKILEKKKLEFSWRRNPEVVDSEIEIAKDAEFTNIYHREIKKSAFLRLEKDIPVGAYFWRLTGILDDKTRTVSSRPWSFSVIQGGVIELISPAEGEVVVPPDSEKSPGVKFSWRRMEIEGSFTVQVAWDREFKNIASEKTVGGYFTEIPSLRQGSYFWRVFMTENDGTVLMKSVERALTIEEKLNAPVLIAPANGMVIDMSSKSSLTFNWNGIPGADAYRLELFLVRNGKEFRIVNKTVRGNTFDMRELSRLDESRFSWTIQALDLERDRIVRQSPVVKSYFDITLGKKLVKPVIRVPKIIFAE